MDDKTASEAGKRLPGPAAAPVLLRLVTAAVVTTLLLFLIAAWQHRDLILAEAARNTVESARILEEHAQKVIGGVAAAKLREMAWMVEDFGWSRIEKDLKIHQRLMNMVSDPEAESIWLLDAEGDVRLTTLASPTPTLNMRDERFFRIHTEPGHGLFVGNVAIGAIHGLPYIPISRRVEDTEGNFLGVVQVSLRPRYFQDFYRAVQADSGATVQLLNEDGSILVHEPTLPGDAAASRHSPAFMANLRSREGTFQTAFDVDGVNRLFGYRKVGNLPLYVVVGLPAESITRTWLSGVGLYALFAVPALVILAVLGWVAFRRTAQMQDAQRQLVMVNAGLEQRVAERTEALERSLAQKEVLLREIHHRVKNNMQVICSLIRLQMSRGGSAEEALDETLKRIVTMGMLHEQLYRSSDIAQIDFGAYLQEICAHVATAYGADERAIEREVAVRSTVMLTLDQAIPMALITNEILSNAFKHAFPGDRRGGKVWVELAATDEHAELVIRDNGVGAVIPPPRRRQSLGLTLVDALSRQLDAACSFQSEGGGGGLTFRLSFPTTGGLQAGKRPAA